MVVHMKKAAAAPQLWSLGVEEGGEVREEGTKAFRISSESASSQWCPKAPPAFVLPGWGLLWFRKSEESWIQNLQLSCSPRDYVLASLHWKKVLLSSGSLCASRVSTWGVCQSADTWKWSWMRNWTANTAFWGWLAAFSNNAWLMFY